MSDFVDVGGISVRIGANIPPYRITTVDLQMTGLQKQLYRKVHAEQRSRMSVGKDPEMHQGRLNHATFRRLCHVALNPELDKFATVKNNVQHVNR